MKIRIGKARSAYYRLNKVWRSSLYRRKTKLRIFQSIVISILLYGCETWKMTEADKHRLDVFFHKCLRKILKIYWPIVITNKEVRKLAKMEQLSQQVKQKRWKYIGHILRKGNTCNERIALRWTPDGKRNRGRPKTTWRRTVERERGMMGFSSWSAAGAVAKDRDRWRRLITGPTPQT